MSRVVDLRRASVYIGFSFGVAWSTALLIYLTGGLQDSPTLVPGIPVTLASVLVPTLYMFSPALAHVLTRLVTREGWEDLHLKPRLGRSWRIWILAWILPVLLTLSGAVVFFGLFPRFFDPSMSGYYEEVSRSAEQMGESLPVGPGALAVILVAAAVFLAPIINSLFTFGEEFGWRGYLQPRLMPLGARRAMVAMGIIWGVWHWPLIAMGLNYSLRYPGSPWLGMLAMVWFTFVLGTVIGWLTVRGGSVWPAVIAHASINASAGLAIFFVVGEPSPLLGPFPTGLVGSFGWSVVALWLLWRWPSSG